MESPGREKIDILAKELERLSYCPDCRHQKCARCVGVSVDVEGPWEKIGVNEQDILEIPRKILDKVVYCCRCEKRNHFVDWMSSQHGTCEEAEERWSLSLKEFAREVIARLARLRGGNVSEKDFEEWISRWVISERNAMQASEMIKHLAAVKTAAK
ncbi:MAG: hypothetical protein HYY45_01920 [Deltaproteobacteria bacterium]|nr:hypothetical protein [Deltaproteobacteria bacterium]